MDHTEPEPPGRSDAGPESEDQLPVSENRGAAANYCAAQQLGKSVGGRTPFELMILDANDEAARAKAAAGPRSRLRRALTARQHMHKLMGKTNYAHSTRVFKVQERFSEEQLRALEGRKGRRQKDLFEFSRIGDDERRNIAIELYIAGSDIEDAIKGAVARTPWVVEKPKTRKGADLTDEQWLERYCSQIRDEIQDLSQFDVDAILWRRTVGARSLDVARNKKDVQRAFVQSRPLFADLLRQVLFIDDPKNWLVCGSCNGRNLSHPDCPECGGRGYVLKMLWPESEGSGSR